MTFIKAHWKTILGIVGVILFVLFLLTGCCPSIETSREQTTVTVHDTLIVPPTIQETLPMVPIVISTILDSSDYGNDTVDYGNLRSKPLPRMIALKIVSGDTIVKAIYDPNKGTLSLWVKPEPVPFQYADTSKTSVKETIYKPGFFERLWNTIDVFGIGYFLGAFTLIGLLVLNKIKKFIPM